MEITIVNSGFQTVMALWCLGLVVVGLIRRKAVKKDSSRYLSSLSTPWAYLRQRLNAYLFLFRGIEMIQQAFDQANGRPFEIHAPDGRYVFVSSPDQIKEIDSAPDTVLSLQAASKQMLQPKYSMHGFNWFDRRGTEGVGFIRALRTLLTNHLPEILPDLRSALSTRLADEVDGNRSPKDDSSNLAVYPMIVKLVVLANSLSFFGPDLAKNEKFMKAALNYVEETLMIAEIIRLLPRCLHRSIGWLLARRITSHVGVYESLLNVAEERVLERDSGAQAKPIHHDCIQWIMDTSPKANPWSAQRVVYELIAIWFGSVHAMSTTITFAIHDLCLHPEYIEPILAELKSARYDEFLATSRGLLLLDSFIKESARLSPVESLSTRRQAIKPFALSDGTQVAVGDWACTPVRALMQSEDYYPSPLTFSGFRFADPTVLPSKSISQDSHASNETPIQPTSSKLTDVDMKHFHVWGTGRMACPGRYYAAAIMKIVVAEILLGYEIEMEDQVAKRMWTWRSSMLPRERTKIRFTPRSQ